MQREFDPQDQSLALRTLVERVRVGGVDPYIDFTLEEALLWGHADPQLRGGFSVFRGILMYDGRPVNFIDRWREGVLVVWATGKNFVVRSKVIPESLELALKGQVTTIAKNGVRWRQLPDHPQLYNNFVRESISLGYFGRHVTYTAVKSNMSAQHCEEVNHLTLTLVGEDRLPKDWVKSNDPIFGKFVLLRDPKAYYVSIVEHVLREALEKGVDQ